MSERRKFSRINFTEQCSLSETTSGKTVTWDTDILDISLNGALIRSPENYNQSENIPVLLSLKLTGSDIVLEIKGVICHQEESFLGVKFTSISLESISHLKRLIQLNLADESLLHREISQLINIDDN
ncbi:PilZ domain-containing protein [Psychromonas antarctica]|uniref:PilZ domain-containing protein n=1 Tax=Psychromonas antarctica TaxID=67573 RepID=UPI001EE831A5|nr:PilZ domain-containing protein [Psychromonas antarctica]MCG6202468.1 PilZ domain-containing protein [Psychromonas antarctica]